MEHLIFWSCLLSYILLCYAYTQAIKEVLFIEQDEEDDWTRWHFWLNFIFAPLTFVLLVIFYMAHRAYRLFYHLIKYSWK